MRYIIHIFIQGIVIMPYVSTKRAGPQSSNVGGVSRGKSVNSTPPEDSLPPRLAFTPSNVSLVIGNHENAIKRMMKSIEDINSARTPEDDSDLGDKIEALEKRLSEMTTKVTTHDGLEEKLGEVSKKVSAHDGLEKKLGEVSKKVSAHDGLEKKLGEMSKKFSSFEKTLGDMSKKVADMEKKMSDTSQD